MLKAICISFFSLSHSGVPAVTMFCTRFMSAPPPAADICACHNFWTTCWNSLNLGGLMALTLIRFWSIFVLILTLNFQGQIWNLLYLNQKWRDWHKMKSKRRHLKSRPQMWPSGLTLAMRHWPSIFKVKYGFCYISAKNGLIAMKQNANIAIEF